MRRYIRTGEPEMEPALLTIASGGEPASFALLHAEDEVYEKTASFRPHVQDVSHLALYLEGEDAILLNGEKVAVGPGSVVLVSPGEEHYLGPTGGNRLVTVELTFAYRGAGGRHLAMPFHDVLALLCGARLHHVAFPVALDGAAAKLVETAAGQVFAAASGSGPLACFEMHQAMLEIFLLLAREVYLPLSERADPAERRLAMARDHIRAAFAEKLPVARLAAMVHMSEGHFSRLFRARFGVSPIAYQQSLRMSAACVLLTSSPRRIGEVARQVGYADVYAFSRMFRRAMGVSPSRYRREHGG